MDKPSAEPQLTMRFSLQEMRQSEAREWILANYNTETISQHEDFDTSGVDWTIEDDNHDDLCIMSVDFDEELVA